MPGKLFHIDAFAAAPFSGNPAAVCLLERMPPAGWMRDFAAEMNLSETAFIASPKGGFPGLEKLRRLPLLDVPVTARAAGKPSDFVARSSQ